MNKRDWQTATPGKSFQMHDAGHVSTSDDLRSVLKVIVDSIGSHLDSNCFFRYRKRAAKSATFVRTIEIDELDSINHLEESPHLVVRFTHELGAGAEVQPAEAMTRLMKPNSSRIASVECVDAEDIDQKLAELISPLRQARTFFAVRSGRVVLADVEGAASGGRNDIIVFVKGTSKRLLGRFAVLTKPGIGHRLAATRLVQRVLDVAAELAQDAESRYPDLWVELVYVTRNKKSDFHARARRSRC